jgi:hypothetical protein
MNHKYLLIACISASLTACASSAPKRVAAVAPAVAPPAASAAATGGVAKAIYDPRMVESERTAKEMGYHVVMRGDEKYFCRTIAPMGTRIPQRECLRADALQQQIHRTEEDRVNIRQFQYCGPSCVPPANAQ